MTQDQSAHPIVLELDEASARALLDALYALGEHQAAGLPISEVDDETNERLNRVMVLLSHHLGGTGRFA